MTYRVIAKRDDDVWLPFFNWYPVVTLNGVTVFDGSSGLTPTGTGPRIWAAWRARREADRLYSRVKRAN